jgi:hypothetical protein
VGLLIVAKADWERIHAKDAEALLGQSGPLLAQMRSARRPFYFRYSVKSGSETDIPDYVNDAVGCANNAVRSSSASLADAHHRASWPVLNELGDNRSTPETGPGWRS